ncbi:MAG: hypothetical protein M1821_009375 [Bathelium mastoideum]|nr:MAG: hypothetical protein M1821_009375 [Bathelium mastoideum]
MMVVPRASAVVPGAADAEAFVIHADHINMVRFDSKKDGGYQTVSGHLQLMVQDASEVIEKRWRKEAMMTEIGFFSKTSKTVMYRYDVSKRTEILQWLSPEPYLQHHGQMKQNTLPGSGAWFLDDKVFKKWKNDPNSSVLWLHGIPGSGKSKLMSIVTEDALQGSSIGQSAGLGFFYCSRNTAEPTRSDPRAILSSLARQLSITPGSPEPSSLEPVVQIYEKREAEGFASGPLTITENCHLIARLTEFYSQHTTLIIDALDECSTDSRSELLEALEMILAASQNRVKILISSRDDQDIVRSLKHHPNLEMSSEKNGADIASFVAVETERLIQKRKLLRYSTSLDEMKSLIISRVTKGAYGMFRWASLQLQALYPLTMDADIQSRLEKLPPKLEDLYSEQYDILSRTPGESHQEVLKNVFSLLLCVRRTLRTEEFLAAVSIVPCAPLELISQEQVLEICNNFVIFDSHLNTFRFAHLSVREFLEKQPTYTSFSINAQVAQICLGTLISWNSIDIERRDQYKIWQLDEFQYRELRNQYRSRQQEHLEHLGLLPGVCSFSQYSAIFWADHYQVAASKRVPAYLTKVLQHFFSPILNTGNALSAWQTSLEDFLAAIWSTGDGVSYHLREKMCKCDAGENSVFFVAASFDLLEAIKSQSRIPRNCATLRNRSGQGILDICAKEGSCNVIIFLLEQRREEVQIPDKVFHITTTNLRNRYEMMELLLERQARTVPVASWLMQLIARSFEARCMAALVKERGDEVSITEEVVKAAAGNGKNGQETMDLLLEWHARNLPITSSLIGRITRSFDAGYMAILLKKWGDEVSITEEVVKAAAGNGDNGQEIMKLLLEQRGDEVQITEEVVKAAARNGENGQEIMELLLEQRGNEVRITKELVIAAQKNERVMLVLLNRRPDEVLLLAILNGVNGFERILNTTLCRFRTRKGWHYFRLKGKRSSPTHFQDGSMQRDSTTTLWVAAVPHGKEP